MSPVDPNEQEPGLFPVKDVLPQYEGRETDFSSEDHLNHLIQVLDIYDQVAETETLMRKFHNGNWMKQQEDSLGLKVARKWQRQTHEKHQQMLDRARQTFRQAYTVKSLLDKGSSEEEANVELDRQYSIFEQAYRGISQGRRTKRQAAREEYQRYLTSELEETVSSEINPDKPTVVTTLAKSALHGARVPEVAGTKDKLTALHDDPRAGFLPTTHTEKNQAFEILDYMDNPQYPSGVNRRLEEIFIHQQKIADDKNIRGREKYYYAVDSVRSVVNEWADHLRSAIQSHAELAKLQEHLNSGINPRISMAEATEPDGKETFDYNVLVRFVDLKRLLEGESLPFDPLATKEDRTIVHDTKNKVLEDQYMPAGTLSEIQDFIDDAAEKLSVKDSRQLIKEALNDQVARRLFWYRALKAVDQDGFKDIAEHALEEAIRPAA